MNTEIHTHNNIDSQQKFETLLEREMDRFRRYQRAFGVVMLSIDQYHNLNESSSATASNEIAGLIQQNSRNLDFSRASSDGQFLIILPESNTDSAFLMAENLRDRIEAHAFQNAVNITCSFGVDMSQPDDEPEDFIKRAERALTKAIEGGGNQVETILEY